MRHMTRRHSGREAALFLSATVGFVAICLGVVAIVESVSVRALAPYGSGGDVLGPAGYLTVVGMLVAVGGVAMAITGVISWLRSTTTTSFVMIETASDEETDGDAPAGDVLPERITGRWLLLWASLLTVAYVLLLPLLGFLVSTFIYVTPLSRVAGMKSWRGACLAGIILTAVLYLMFVVFLGMPLPRSKVLPV